MRVRATHDKKRSKGKRDKRIMSKATSRSAVDVFVFEMLMKGINVTKIG